MKNIRNFAIIAHIDHGKSTLSDRMIQICGALTEREMSEQVLDSMDIEKERGITIKSQTVQLNYKKNGEDYILNLMDTPGHVDFGYEVSRCLSACEGAILVVDATQGVEAQTLANVYKAIDNDLEIIVVLNKIDLPSSHPEEVKEEIENLIGLDTSDAISCSAKTGEGVEDVLDAIIERIPAPKKTVDFMQALLVDAWYDMYLGVIILVRVYGGEIKRGMKIRMMESGTTYEIDSVGVFLPKRTEKTSLTSGQVGFVNANIKTISDCHVGDTLVMNDNPNPVQLPGFKKVQQVVFCGLYPQDASQFEDLKVALGKLALNDSSFTYTLESSSALGLGFRCGFLGLLHMEVGQERLLREFNIDLVTTAPSVVYKVEFKDGTEDYIYNATNWPDYTKVKEMYEPWIKATIFSPEKYLGSIMKLCQGKRGEQISLDYMSDRVMIVYRIPLNEVIFDFHDKLKLYTSGYASFEWEMDDYRLSQLVKLDILVNGDPLPELSIVVDKASADKRGRMMCEKLKDLIPRQMYKVAIQATIGGKIIARETISAFRKDVTAKCYGGDVTRKKKLLEKQKKGKKRMRNIGNIEVPHSVFVQALKVDD